MNAHPWMPMSAKTKKRLWVALLVSVGALVVCAMLQVAFMGLGSPEEEVLATVSLAAGLSILCIVAVVTWHAPRNHASTVLGLVAAISAITTTFVSEWWGSTLVYNPTIGVYPRWFYPLLGASWTLAIAFPTSNLLTLSRLPSGWCFVRFVTLACIWGFAFVFILLMCRSFLGRWVHEDDLVRLAVGLALVGFFGAILTVALHFRFVLGQGDPLPVAATSLVVCCPACGLNQTLPFGDSACSACRLRFHIEVEAPTCPQCGYLCLQLTSDRCPECGTVLATVP